MTSSTRKMGGSYNCNTTHDINVLAFIKK